MALCDFCGKNFEKGTGKMFIRDNGKILRFCTNKCEKFMLKYKKKGREQKWTDTFHEEKKSHSKATKQPENKVEKAKIEKKPEPKSIEKTKQSANKTKKSADKPIKKPADKKSEPKQEKKEKPKKPVKLGDKK